MTTEIHRASFTAELRSARETKDKGHVKARVAAYDVEYQMGFRLRHVIEAGAFESGVTVPVFFGHSWTDGTPPIGHGSVTTSGRGLDLDAQLFLASEDGRRVFDSIKARALKEWSIAYKILKFTETTTDDGWTTVRISEAELLEASSVLRGANPETETLQVAAASAVDLDQLERKSGVTHVTEVADVVTEMRQATDRKQRIRERFGIQVEPYSTSGFDAMVSAMEHEVARGFVGERVWSLSKADTRAFLSADPDPLGGDAGFLPTEASHQAVPAGPLDLVTLTPHPEGSIKLPSVTRTTPAGLLAAGGTASDLGFGATGGAETMARVVASASFDKGALDANGIRLPSILRALRDGIREGTNIALTTADGSIDGFRGIKTVVGRQTLAAGALSKVVALARSARLVQDAGFGGGGGLGLIGNPTSVTESLLGQTIRNEVPAISTYIAAKAFTTGGEFVTGDWQSGCELFVQPVAISMSVDHSNNFVAGRLTFVAELRCRPWWKQPTAFVHVTGLVA